jgi:hypothetical protein
MIGKVYRKFGWNANTMWSLFQSAGKGNYIGNLSAMSRYDKGPLPATLY